MSHGPRQIPFDDAIEVSKRAQRDIVNWLHSLPQTLEVRNVEDVPEFQKLDVDLIWTTQKRRYKVEIKGDQWDQTGNFFLETKSNKERGTPGCFLYTHADLVFYYFVQPRILYILPMPLARNWFRFNLHRFEERSTTTPIGRNSYTTVGRLVPINTVLEEVPEVRRVLLRES